MTDYAIPQEFFFEDLSKALSVKTVNGRTYSILGAELVDITGLLPNDGDPETIQGLRAGDIVRFEVTPAPLFYGQNIRFYGSAWLSGGEHFLPTLSYAAEIQALVSYRDGVFTLTQIHLS